MCNFKYNENLSTQCACSIIDQSQYKLVKKFICKYIYDLKLKINWDFMRGRNEKSNGGNLCALNMISSLCTVHVRDTYEG